MQKTLVTLFLIAGTLLFPNSSIIAKSATELPYFAGDSSSVDTTEGDLVLFNASKGIFPLPLSANSIPDGAFPTDNPTLALADTLVLSDDSEDTSGLVIYRVADGMLFLNTLVGHGNESAHSASYFGVGDFVIVMTAGKNQCAYLTLSECRSSRYFLKESPFSIQ